MMSTVSNNEGKKNEQDDYNLDEVASSVPTEQPKIQGKKEQDGALFRRGPPNSSGKNMTPETEPEKPMTFDQFSASKSYKL